jgi:hypothetical protein
MKSVVIHSNHPNDENNTSLMLMLLDAGFGNRRHIRELKCQCRVPITQFSWHTQSTTVLTTLDIHFLSASEYTPSKRNAIEAAFLFKLFAAKFVRVYTKGDVIATVVLNGLKNGHTVERYRLRELELSCGKSDGFVCWTAFSPGRTANSHRLELKAWKLPYLDTADSLRGSRLVSMSAIAGGRAGAAGNTPCPYHSGEPAMQWNLAQWVNSRWERDASGA